MKKNNTSFNLHKGKINIYIYIHTYINVHMYMQAKVEKNLYSDLCLFLFLMYIFSVCFFFA